MKIDGATLGPMASQFFAWSQARRVGEVRTGDLVRAMRLSAKQEADLFYQLSQAGLILQLWRGFYLVPRNLPPGGRWNPSPYLIVNKYMQGCGAKYQVSGAVVFSSYGLSTQLASEFVVYNDRISKTVQIRQYRFVFVKVKAERLGGTKEFIPFADTQEDPEDGKAVVSSMERALLDAVYDYKRFGTLPEAYEWIARTVRDGKAKGAKLAEMAEEFGNTMSKKRIGWALEALGVDRRALAKLKRSIPDTQFLVPLDPRNANGAINEKWGVIENARVPA